LAFNVVVEMVLAERWMVEMVLAERWMVEMVLAERWMVEMVLAERWMVLRLSKRLVLIVVKDGELDAITSRRSVKDVRSPSLCMTAKELGGRLLAGITVVVDKFNVVAMLDDF
jgi:hypothetical protein